LEVLERENVLLLGSCRVKLEVMRMNFDEGNGFDGVFVEF
jgi:hypothetical protein